MKRNKKIIIAAIIGLAAIGGVWYFIRRKNINTSGVAPVFQWDFTDNIFTSTGKSTSNLGFVGKTKPPFKVGQWVNVKQNAGATYPQYDGKTLVQNIERTQAGWVIDVDKKRLGDTPVNGGVITSI